MTLVKHSLTKQEEDEIKPVETHNKSALVQLKNYLTENIQNIYLKIRKYGKFTDHTHSPAGRKGK